MKNKNNFNAGLCMVLCLMHVVFRVEISMYFCNISLNTIYMCTPNVIFQYNNIMFVKVTE